jgi:homoserine kinase
MVPDGGRGRRDHDYRGPVLARAPGSSANLGPGFDALAVALDVHVEVEITSADTLTVTSTGHGSDLPADATHLAARLAVEIRGTDRLAIRVHSDIPVGRGLGSSAALAVATAAAAGADDPMHWGVLVDGHPENAAASALGGLVAAATVAGRPVARRLPLDPVLRFVLLVPDTALVTAEARRVLPATVPHADAAFNLGRLGLLVAGLADHAQLVAAATDDRIHQDARAALFPAAPALLAGLLAAGALAACWSGAGPSLLALATTASAPALAAVATGLLADHGVPGRVHVLAADGGGVTVTRR